MSLAIAPAAGTGDAGAPPSIHSASIGTRAVPILLFAGALLAFMGGAKGYICNCDAAIRYLVAQRIWQDGTTLIKADEPLLAALEIVPRTATGEAISFYGIGQSLTMLPAVVLADAISRSTGGADDEKFSYVGGQFLFSVLLLPLFSALGLLCVYVLGRRLGLSALHAAWSVVALGFGTFWFYYSKTVDMNIEVCLLALAALVVYTGGTHSWWRTSLTSFLFGAIFHYRQECLLPVALTLGVLAFLEWRAARLTPSFMASLLFPAFALGCFALWHNYLRSGNVFESFPGYFKLYVTEERSAALAASKPLTPQGLLFGTLPFEYLPLLVTSLKKGLIWYSPVLIVGLFALVPRALRWNKALTLGAIPLLAFLLFISCLRWSEFEGGWGPRYLLLVTPFVVLGLAFALGPLLVRRRAARAIAAGIVVAVCFQIAISWEGHNCHLEQNKILNAELLARGMTAEDAYSYSSSLLIARLRNIGIMTFDPPAVREAWALPEMEDARSQLADRFWWQKLAAKTSNRLAAQAIATLGMLLAATGIALIARALYEAGQPLGHIAGAPLPATAHRGAIATAAAGLIQEERTRQEVRAS